MDKNLSSKNMSHLVSKMVKADPEWDFKTCYYPHAYKCVTYKLQLHV